MGIETGAERDREDGVMVSDNKQLTQEQIDATMKVEDAYLQEVNYLSSVEYALQKMKTKRMPENDAPR